MVFAWNTKISESLGVSPFEVMTGYMPRIGPSSVLGRKAAQKEALNMPAIRVAAVEYTRFAAANADYNRKKNADHLIKFGRKLKEIPIGALVKIYAPPGHKEAIRRQREKKSLVAVEGTDASDTEAVGGTFCAPVLRRPSTGA